MCSTVFLVHQRLNPRWPGEEDLYDSLKRTMTSPLRSFLGIFNPCFKMYEKVRNFREFLDSLTVQNSVCWDIEDEITFER